MGARNGRGILSACAAQADDWYTRTLEDCLPLFKTSRPDARLLVIDDESAALRSARRTLTLHGFRNIETCEDSREALSRIRDGKPDIVLLDLVMPHVDGATLLPEMTRLFPDLPVLIVTAEGDLDTAVGCMRKGAADYMVKPVAGERMATTVDRVLGEQVLRSDHKRLSERFFSDDLEHPAVFQDILTQDESMLRVFGFLEAVSPSSHSVLIVGETGTGKELLARALHKLSRPKEPFVAVNVAGLDENLFADTLFGHDEGAYTGADQKRSGMIESAGAGTLFLDEIGDLSESSQVKLLRLLQEREYFPLGADKPKLLEARVVAATHKDPSLLRPDLYYRLRSYVVRVPRLAERVGDLPILVEHFLERAAEDLGIPKPTVPQELYTYLGDHDFPGNVRELAALVFDAVANHRQGVMRIDSFLAQLVPKTGDAPQSPQPRVNFSTPMPSMKALEDAAFAEALRRTRGNQSAAAKLLGVSRPTIGRYVAKQRDADSPRLG